MEKVGFEVGSVNPLKYNAPGLHVPVLFIDPLDDQPVSEDTKKLFEAYAAEQKTIASIHQYRPPHLGKRATRGQKSASISASPS
jgi:hypothetical protein